MPTRAEGFFCGRRHDRTGDEQAWRTMTDPEARQVTGAQEPDPRARGGRRRHGLRHPRGSDPAGVRPAARLDQDPPHPGPARAGRRPRGSRAMPPPPAGSGSAWRPAVPARPTSSRRSPTPTWTRCRSSRSPARSPSAAIGTDAFQEADIRGITMPITKHNYLVTDPDADPARDRRGVPHRGHRAPGSGARRHRQGRAPGDDRRSFTHETVTLPGYRPVTKPHGKQVREAARLIAASERPVLYVGGGCHPRARRTRSCASWPS